MMIKSFYAILFLLLTININCLFGIKIFVKSANKIQIESVELLCQSTTFGLFKCKKNIGSLRQINVDKNFADIELLENKSFCKNGKIVVKVSYFANAEKTQSMHVSKLVDVDVHFLYRATILVITMEAPNGEEQQTLNILPYRKQCFVEVYCKIVERNGNATVFAFGTGQKEAGTSQIHFPIFNEDNAKKCYEEKINAKIHYDENKEKIVTINVAEFFDASKPITIDLMK